MLPSVIASAIVIAHAAAVPGGGRYVVVQSDGDGGLRVIHDVAAPQAPLRDMDSAAATRALARPPRGGEAWLLEGARGFRTVVDIPGWLHVPLGTGGEALVPAPARVGVARLPAGESVVARRGATGRPVPLVLAPGGGTAAPPPDDDDNRVDVLVLGDGYTAGQEPLFQDHARQFQEQFLGVAPYADYANFFRFQARFTPSESSGADHPPYRSSCVAGDRTCCADPDMSQDPLAGTLVATAFDASFCYFNIHRLIYVDEPKVLAAAAAAPGWDAILVLVNDATYGGAGGNVTVASVNARAALIGHHEFGHSFTRLADEYDSPYPSYPTCSDLAGPACEANVTDVTGRDGIKWLAWITQGTPVPTPESSRYAGDVGLFQGARYQASGMYRPMQACAMSVSEAPFCPVCREAFVLRLFEGGWGAPANGVDILEPGGDLPAAGPVAADHGESLAFRVRPREPRDGADVDLRWFVDGTEVPGEHAAVFTYVPPSPRRVSVAVQARDATGMVAAGHDDALTSRRAWEVRFDNRPPQLAGPATVRAEEGAALVVTLEASDPDGDPVTVTASGLPPGASYDDGSRQLSWTPDFDQAGRFSVGFAASDGEAQVSIQVDIDVAHVNRPPALAPLPPRQASVGERMEAAVEAADPDGDRVVLRASGLPVGAVFDEAAGTFAWTPGEGDVGRHAVTVTASDGALLAGAVLAIQVTPRTERREGLAERGCGCQGAMEGTAWSAVVAALLAAMGIRRRER